MCTGSRVNTCALAHIIGVDGHAFLDDTNAADDLGRLVGELEHLIVGLVEHHVNVPLKVVGANGSGANVELETGVAHVTHVVVVAIETG